MLFDTMPFGASAFGPDMRFGTVSAPILFQGRDPYLYSPSPDLQHSPSQFLPTEIPIKHMDRKSPAPSRQCDESEPVVYNIPIRVEGRDDGPAVPQRQFPADRRPQSPRTQRPENQMPASDATGRQMKPGLSASRLRSATPESSAEEVPVRSIPVHMETSSKPRDRSSSPAPAPKRKKTPQEQIDEANARLKELREDVETFSGTSCDKQYRYLDEMLTRLLISLDNVETEGNEQLRVARKETIRSIQQCADVLENKVKVSQEEQPIDRQGVSTTPTPGQPDATISELENGAADETTSQTEVPAHEMTSQPDAPADEQAMDTETGEPVCGSETAESVQPAAHHVEQELAETGSSESHL